MGKASRSAATAISPAGLGGQGRWNALGRWRGLRAYPRGRGVENHQYAPQGRQRGMRKAAAGLRSATVFQRPVALRACRSGRDTQPVRQMSPPVALCPLLGGGLNRSPQHFILEGKDGVWDGTEIS